MRAGDVAIVEDVLSVSLGRLGSSEGLSFCAKAPRDALMAKPVTLTHRSRRALVIIGRPRSARIVLSVLYRGKGDRS
jgi:hypothetical protein